MRGRRLGLPLAVVPAVLCGGGVGTTARFTRAGRLMLGGVRAAVTVPVRAVPGAARVHPRAAVRVLADMTAVPDLTWHARHHSAPLRLLSDRHVVKGVAGTVFTREVVG